MHNMAERHILTKPCMTTIALYGSVSCQWHLLIIFIRVTLITELDPLQSVMVGIPMTRLSRMYYTSPESWVLL